MYTVSVSASFEATHSLRLYDGQLEPAHNHAWNVRASFAGPELDRIGVLVDFTVARTMLKEITASLTGTHLNGWSALDGQNPSAERVAEAIFRQLAAAPELAPTLYGVTVTEAPGCEAAYLRKDSLLDSQD